MIHSTAVIHPKAQLDPTVKVGPYAVIDEAVVVGPGCVIGPHVYLTGRTTIGARNHFHAGCVIGDAPQDLSYKGEPTCLRLGDHNVVREHVTLHRSNKPTEDTVIGSHNYIMAHCHVAHNCRLGDRIILVNGTILGGHVTVADGAFISGNCGVHQFVRIGTLAMMQGGAILTTDLPPFCTMRDVNVLCGLNTVGLRRAGLPGEQRMELRRLYHLLFRGGRKWKEALAAAREEFTGAPARALLDFVSVSQRGLCADPRRGGFRPAEPVAGGDED